MAQKTLYSKADHPRQPDGTYATIYEEPVSKIPFAVRLPNSVHNYLMTRSDRQQLAREILTKALREIMELEGKDDTK